MVQKVGLRERKKRATMRRIQEVALDLFDAHGYEGVTIEQIAEAADVSPSSVYRYFGTKERIVLFDDVDVDFLSAMEGSLTGRSPVEAMRQALAGAMAQVFARDEELARRKTSYALEEPALRAAMLETTDELASQVAAILARSLGREPADLDIQVTAATLVWPMVAAVRHWHAGGYRTSIEDEMERALTVVEHGLAAEGRRSRG